QDAQHACHCGGFRQLADSAPRRSIVSACWASTSCTSPNKSIMPAASLDLFGEVQEEEAQHADPYERFRNLRDWSLKERLQGEKDTLGLFVTGHPFDEYETEVRKLVPTKLSHLQEGKAPQKLAGLVVDMRLMK